jgi:hypothetical protein
LLKHCCDAPFDSSNLHFLFPCITGTPDNLPAEALTS